MRTNIVLYAECIFEMMRGKIIFVVLLSFMIFVMVGGVKSADTNTSSSRSQQNPIVAKIYTPHPLIRINNDADFDNQFPGRVISGYEINGTGKGYCLYVGNCSIPFTIMDCFIHHGYGNNGQYFWDSGIILAWCSNGTVMNNICAQGGEGITLWASTNNVVKENTCFLGFLDGIYLDHSGNNNITNNHCYANTLVGICVWDSCTGNKITKNNLSGNTRSGIKLYLSTNNLITENNCAKNVRYGASLELSNNNILNHNNYTQNDRNGVWLWNSFRNTITYNNITGNAEHGILMDQFSKYNRINHNKIENNNGATSTFDPLHSQAIDNTGLNFWNTSTEGNYWSDWTSPDNDSNGIVDFPYPIDGGKGAKDYRPLTTKITIPEIPYIILITGTVIFGCIDLIISSNNNRIKRIVKRRSV